MPRKTSQDSAAPTAVNNRKNMPRKTSQDSAGPTGVPMHQAAAKSGQGLIQTESGRIL
jgi:hypothetical protein